ncbi:hypothetical protein BDA96_06G231800 [Sorghum bicolor]|uniref:Uncharacterized protein n=2 Tax=Sorghum bicolor TaxID=4558 RepID=A0A921QUD4_SORBI|nr:hypothetical protein BDA96_06G231800 [Sorghum bicolor]OQU82310.1 hypothetical protein SORBI_3006G212350 [Sorghum bicolor]
MEWEHCGVSECECCSLCYHLFPTNLKMLSPYTWKMN